MVSVAPKNKALPNVSVVIVTYMSTQELPGCLESLMSQTVPVEVFVVDNASPDNTPQMVSDYAARFENIHPILNSQNLGLAAANNCLLGRCRGEYVLILNPDTVLRKDTLERMVGFLDRHSDVGVLGPKNVYEDGIAHTSFHRNWGIRHVILWRLLPYQITRAFYDRFSSFKAQDVLFVSGACLLIRRSIFEQIGGYDPEYFLTVEDVADLCIRARQTGCRVVFSPEAEIIHFTARSGAQAPYIVIWHANRGTIYHFLKHKGIVQALLVSVLLLSFAAARAMVEGILGVFSTRYRRPAKLYARVFWDIILRNPVWARA
jgi:GT2 family glycosyltransferase